MEDSLRNQLAEIVCRLAHRIPDATSSCATSLQVADELLSRFDVRLREPANAGAFDNDAILTPVNDAILAPEIGSANPRAGE